MTDFLFRHITLTRPGNRSTQPALEIGLPVHLKKPVIAGDRPPTVVIPLDELHEFTDDGYCVRFFTAALDALLGPGGWTRGEFAKLATLVEHQLWELPQKGPPPPGYRGGQNTGRGYGKG